MTLSSGDGLSDDGGLRRQINHDSRKRKKNQSIQHIAQQSQQLTTSQNEQKAATNPTKSDHYEHHRQSNHNPKDSANGPVSITEMCSDLKRVCDPDVTISVISLLVPMMVESNHRIVALCWNEAIINKAIKSSLPITSIYNRTKALFPKTIAKIYIDLIGDVVIIGTNNNKKFGTKTLFWTC
eukprot:758884_1